MPIMPYHPGLIAPRTRELWGLPAVSGRVVAHAGLLGLGPRGYTGAKGLAYVNALPSLVELSQPELEM